MDLEMSCKYYMIEILHIYPKNQMPSLDPKLDDNR